ncbi:unnamed protein product [Spirodela intermedia]|uniref:RING-type E3 ubiquitin transferase n=1 Tax=Spirodela intermedia TaxID=51605 RepID=A0A7I8K1I5_SPIIN|nr:unnamed protein product [Spirodela intermedia]
MPYRAGVTATAGAVPSTDLAAAGAAASPSSYWCHRCTRFVRVSAQDPFSCADCATGFLEEVDASSGPGGEFRRRRSPPRPRPPVTMSILSAAASRRLTRHSDMDLRRFRHAAAWDRSPFNPIIVLRGQSGGAGIFEYYYDDGAGSGLRPLPASMSDFLMGSGVDRLLEQLAQLDLTGGGRARGCENPPASTAAIDSMPTIEIAESHLCMEAHCAVCKEPFELGLEAREMPCRHIYHHDCILPWLSLRNSCPVCRHEMPAGEERTLQESDADESSAVGLTIWRLPGGGFAVGRFSGGRSAGETGLPGVFTEMDGGFNAGGGAAQSRMPSNWRSGRSRASRGIGNAFRNLLFLLGLRRRSSSSSSSFGWIDRRPGNHSSIPEPANPAGISGR